MDAQSQVGIYEGIYIAHCKFERIEVVRPRFWFIKRYEPWLPIFPEDFVRPVPESPGLSEPEGCGYKIKFSGIPGPTGAFGYMGQCEREVRIVTVLEFHYASIG